MHYQDGLYQRISSIMSYPKLRLEVPSFSTGVILSCSVNTANALFSQVERIFTVKEN
jgi:hypothetical protein